MTRKISLFALYVLVAVILVWMIARVVGPAFAAPTKKHVPSARAGHALAKKFCANCHVVDPQQTSAVPASVPTFGEIANRTLQTPGNIAANLLVPHYPMPDMRLTRNEITDIIAYLDSLRGEGVGPPLLDRSQPGEEPQKPPTPS